MANVTCPVFTFLIASFISATLSSKAASGLNIIHADNPCGIVLVGITITFTSSSRIVAVCCAVITILELFGSMITFLAFKFLIASFALINGIGQISPLASTVVIPVSSLPLFYRYALKVPEIIAVMFFIITVFTAL